MNNKYDINNFSKILEEYNNEDEIRVMREHLQDGNTQNVPKFDFIPYESKMYNIANI